MNDKSGDEIYGKGEQAIKGMVSDMTNDDLKVILSVSRPNGLDVADTVIVAASERAKLDLGLRDWLVESQSWDSEIANALGNIQPPAGLRERILPIGEEQLTASRDQPDASNGSSSETARKTPWMAMAAAALLLVGGTFFLSQFLRTNSAEDPEGSVARNDGEVTPLAGGVSAEYASWHSDALQSVDQILEAKLESDPMSEERVDWAWIDQQVPPKTSELTSSTPGKAIGAHILNGEGVACLSVDKPHIGHYALLCFKVGGTLSHLAVFDGVREIPHANESGIAVRQYGRWQTVSWVEEGRTMMFFFFPTDVKDPAAWAEELMNIKLTETK